MVIQYTNTFLYKVQYPRNINYVFNSIIVSVFLLCTYVHKINTYTIIELNKIIIALSKLHFIKIAVSKKKTNQNNVFWVIFYFFVSHMRLA